MLGALLRLFFWWWPALPGWLRYTLSGVVVALAIVAWIIRPEAWPAWILGIFMGLCMAMYGEPSEAEKKGYRY